MLAALPIAHLRNKIPLLDKIWSILYFFKFAAFFVKNPEYLSRFVILVVGFVVFCLAFRVLIQSFDYVFISP